MSLYEKTNLLNFITIHQTLQAEGCSLTENQKIRRRAISFQASALSLNQASTIPPPSSPLRDPVPIFEGNNKQAFLLLLLATWVNEWTSSLKIFTHIAASIK